MTWVVSAWRLFRTQAQLWMCAALPFFLIFIIASLLVTGRLQLILPTMLSAIGVPLGFHKLADFLISLVLLLVLLLANLAMTSMANKTVRGEALGVRDLFRFRGLRVTSLVLITTLVATALGSLVFFVGAITASGFLVGAQSTALRTGRFRASLRASASVMRTDTIRMLGLAVFLALAVTIGFVTGGLALLVVLPVSKIIGGLADAYGEALGATEPGTAVGCTPVGGLMPRPVQFHWTEDEEVMVRQTTPPLHMPHLLAAVLVVGLAAFLLFPRLPAAPADRPASQDSVQPASAYQADPASETQADPALETQADPAPETRADPAPPVTSIPDAQADSLPVPSNTSATEPVFVESYGTGNDPPLPCQMHWGNFTVRIESIGTEDGPDGRQEKLSVVDSAGSPVYTVTNEYVGSVKLEKLLGGEQPELLVDTGQGGDGKTCMDLALTQQGGVHDIYLLNDKDSVAPLHIDGKASEEVVVNTSLDGPCLDIHHYPTLTSTYRWDGVEFENANAYTPKPTQERIEQYEQILTDPANSTKPDVDGDDWETSMQTATVGLLANASLLGQSQFPRSVTVTPGNQLGVAWVRENTQSVTHICQQIADAKRPLPKVESNAITGESGLPDQM